jgi:leucyl/phenylalanyl-tRNA---protein transferase
MLLTLSAPLLLRAYAAGVFPMAESADSPHVDWYEPEMRGVLPLESFHLPRRLARTVRSGGFEVTFDQDFTGVMRACAKPTPGRTVTWINQPILDGYADLFAHGFAHSVECRRDGRLTGGLYGVALGGAFFGESMFSLERDASKVALVHLAARLQAAGYVLLDTQFITEHLRQFGAAEINRADYHARLDAALAIETDWSGVDQPAALQAFLGRP